MELSGPGRLAEGLLTISFSSFSRHSVDGNYYFWFLVNGIFFNIKELFKKIIGESHVSRKDSLYRQIPVSVT